MGRTRADSKYLASLLDAADSAFDLGPSDRLPPVRAAPCNAFVEWELEVSAVRRLLAAPEPGARAIEWRSRGTGPTSTNG